MRKKPFVCECGNPAYRRKLGEPICLRCDRLEKEQSMCSFPDRLRRTGRYTKDVENNLTCYEEA